jgi:hypothetical protein
VTSWGTAWQKAASVPVGPAAVLVAADDVVFEALVLDALELSEPPLQAVSSAMAAAPVTAVRTKLLVSCIAAG